MCSNLEFLQDCEDIAAAPIHEEEEVKILEQVGTLDELYLDSVSPAFQVYREEEIGKFCSFNYQNLPLICISLGIFADFEKLQK